MYRTMEIDGLEVSSPDGTALQPRRGEPHYDPSAQAVAPASLITIRDTLHTLSSPAGAPLTRTCSSCSSQITSDFSFLDVKVTGGRTYYPSVESVIDVLAKIGQLEDEDEPPTSPPAIITIGNSGYDQRLDTKIAASDPLALDSNLLSSSWSPPELGDKIAASDPFLLASSLHSSSSTPESLLAGGQSRLEQQLAAKIAAMNPSPLASSRNTGSSTPDSHMTEGHSRSEQQLAAKLAAMDTCALASDRPTSASSRESPTNAAMDPVPGVWSPPKKVVPRPQTAVVALVLDDLLVDEECPKSRGDFDEPSTCYPRNSMKSVDASTDTEDPVLKEDEQRNGVVSVCDQYWWIWVAVQSIIVVVGICLLIVLLRNEKRANDP